VDPAKDTVYLDNRKIDLSPPRIIVLALNKPEGVLSTVSDDRGRTTVLDDPIEGIHKNGLTYLTPCLESHRPVDVVTIALGTRVKTPGDRMIGDDVELILTRQPGVDKPPYQRLLGDAMHGISDLFTREDIVDAEWRIVDNVLGDVTPLYRYKPGTWGPDEADQLVGRDGPWLNPKPA